MTLAEMRERKRELGYSYERIADMSGVPLSTVQKVFSGATQSPRYDTLLAIETVLEDYSTTRVSETATHYGNKATKRQGEYTVEDYYNWPEDERIELIDGVIYDMAAPTYGHQDVVGEIAFAFKKFVKERKGKCRVNVSPLDVQLDCDDKTMVQPDIMIICNTDIITNNHLYGAPDLIVEVLSKSTRKKDMGVKLAKYINANVREYWIIDIEKERVIVYDIEHDIQVKIYTFENKVPVGIWNGECVVDFVEIKNYLEDWQE